MSLSHSTTRVSGAKNVDYFVPAQEPAAGTALTKQSSGEDVPLLFKPLTIRGVTFPNRVWLSALDQYSSKDGSPSAWHLAHIGGIATRGPGLSIMECTAIQARGRITPEDAGIWDDRHIAEHKVITDFVHSQNQKIGIQLAHAGRKASTRAAWLQSSSFGVGLLVAEEDGGWPNDLIAPSAIAWSDKLGTPRAMTTEDIKDSVEDWKKAAQRAVNAGFDVIELHGAHGFLLNAFISPTSNKRTDQYGGSFENRIRYPLEVIDAVRSVIPKDMPLFYRISATEWCEKSLPNEPSWTVEDTVKFAGIIADHGVDLIDLSSGGNSQHQRVEPGHLYQVPFAAAVKKAHGDKILAAAVGGITNGNDAQRILTEGSADITLVGRAFQKNPGTVWKFAEDLGVEIFMSHQMEWPYIGRGGSVTRRLPLPEA
ncbi:hypothetical protein EIP91_009060 [Steccherinum ochraceum]|uniref:NADH:flavin oxidoreductase/NADH oxidase N-terminal domain-containing protein n=1 Tax=Steccherinum ochraceum TaxID=92696 RepID=A0A4R0R4E9_9APHY|nr:hypothetical protein EIP91_009060 [Steccherinum ochraceum]